MLKYHFSFFFAFVCYFGFSQSQETAPLPSKFDGMTEAITVNHFPSPVYASVDPDIKDRYIWKHNTSLISSTENIEVIEGGAFIYFNDQWNLRVSMDAREFAKLFNIPKGKMKAGEPYTFVENWRYDSRLLGGWAMWYIIAKDSKGNQIYGVGKLDTVGSLYPSNHKD